MSSNKKIWIVTYIRDIGGCNPHLSQQLLFNDEQSAYEHVADSLCSSGLFEVYLDGDGVEKYTNLVKLHEAGDYRAVCDHFDPDHTGMYVVEKEFSSCGRL